MSQESFQEKWSATKAGGTAMNLEEKSIYVEKGDIPRTQRQLSLYWTFQFIRPLLEDLGATTAVELGCGRGTIAMYCRDYLGIDMTLLDVDEGAIAIAREGFAERGLDAVFVVGDALRTGLPDGAFDAAISIGLAEHIDKVGELFTEQLRILRPGGLMISLNIPSKFSVQYLNYAMRALKKVLGLYKESIVRDYYRNAFTGEEYARFARDVGFATADVTYIGPFAFYIPVRRSTDRAITTIRRAVLRLRSLVMPYPYKRNRVMALQHVLVARKPG